MPQLKPLPLRRILRKLKKAGFVEVGQQGSHIKFAKQTDRGTLTTIVPNHKEIPVGTLHSILRQAGLTVEEFLAL